MTPLILAAAQDVIVDKHWSSTQSRVTTIETRCTNKETIFSYTIKNADATTIVKNFVIDNHKIDSNTDPLISLLRKNYLEHIEFWFCSAEPQFYLLEGWAEFRTPRKNLDDKHSKNYKVYFTYRDNTSIKMEIVEK